MLVKTWDYDGAKPVGDKPGSTNSVIFLPGKTMTFNMVAITGAKATFTCRVDKMNSKAAKDRRTGDLKLVIISSQTTLPSVRRNKR